MFCWIYSQFTSSALLLAGASLVALGSSAGISTARADAAQAARGQANRCRNFQVVTVGKVDHRPFVLEHDSLVVSSSTYDRVQGAVASLSIGTKLPNSATKTTNAVANNDYVHVWNNSSVDASFGVTSAIAITDVDPSTGQLCHSLTVPTEQVVTSFRSKSELGLHLFVDNDGPHGRMWSS